MKEYKNIHENKLHAGHIYPVWCCSWMWKVKKLVRMCVCTILSTGTGGSPARSFSVYLHLQINCFFLLIIIRKEPYRLVVLNSKAIELGESLSAFLGGVKPLMRSQMTLKWPWQKVDQTVRSDTRNTSEWPREMHQTARMMLLLPHNRHFKTLLIIAMKVP